MELREYIDKLEQLGQLNTIEETIDWNLQAGAISTMSNQIGGPAVHFTNVKDYPKGFSLAGGLYTGPPNVLYDKAKPWSRQAIMLGLDPEVGWEQFVSEMMTGITNTVNSIRVTSGPCKQSIISGNDVDVLKLPVPYLHQGDGGRYGTCSFTIVKDPETNWQYWGYHRWMVVDGNRLSGPLEPTIAPFLFFPPYHLSIIYQKYCTRNQDMPFCIVIGGDPVNLLAAASYVPEGFDQAAMAGGLAKDSIALVRAETNDLLVPTDAEIVIEGVVSSQDRAEEGPFPEIVRRTPKVPQPVYHVKAITHRDNPIFTFSAEGGKYSDILALRSTMVSLALTQHMRQSIGSYPVIWINMPVETAMALCMVSLNRDVHSAGAPAAVARALFLHPLSGWFDKVFIGEHPCEAVDWLEVLNQFNDQVNPAIGCQFITGLPSNLVDYSNSDAKNEFMATKLYIDATRPAWWDPAWVGRRQTLESNYPGELLDGIVSRWKELELPGEPKLKKGK